MTEEEALEAAVSIGNKSPCQKSKRGVVIFNQYGLLGWGNNHPPKPFVCDGSEGCRGSCNKLAVHAEQAALIDAMNDQEPMLDAEMLHVKVIDGVAVPSGPPSCWQCSRLILDSGIQKVWLLHENGLKSYSAVEFHEETLKNCNLPEIKI